MKNKQKALMECLYLAGINEEMESGMPNVLDNANVRQETQAYYTKLIDHIKGKMSKEAALTLLGEFMKEIIDHTSGTLSLNAIKQKIAEVLAPHEEQETQSMAGQ